MVNVLFSFPALDHSWCLWVYSLSHIVLVTIKTFTSAVPQSTHILISFKGDQHLCPLAISVEILDPVRLPTLSIIPKLVFTWWSLCPGLLSSAWQGVNHHSWLHHSLLVRTSLSWWQAGTGMALWLFKPGWTRDRKEVEIFLSLGGLLQGSDFWGHLCCRPFIKLEALIGFHCLDMNELFFLYKNGDLMLNSHPLLKDSAFSCDFRLLKGLEWWESLWVLLPLREWKERMLEGGNELVGKMSFLFEQLNKQCCWILLLPMASLSFLNLNFYAILFLLLMCVCAWVDSTHLCMDSRVRGQSIRLES